MSGFKVKTASIINMIRANLTDRYRDSYSVIKELIQNSDDARATRLDIGWSGGLGDAAAHPLLADPAVFVINNGRFTPSDAKAVQSIHLSNKTAERDKIGQFGLGMKSVFHLCEAFVYAWPGGNDQKPYPEAVCGQSIHGGVINPWNGLAHADWDRLEPRDLDAIHRHLQPVISVDNAGESEPWFVVWLPLRRHEHGRDSDGREARLFETDYASGPEGVGFFDVSVANDLPRLLPLLRHLRTIRLWCEQDEGMNRVLDATMSSAADRCRYRADLEPDTYRLDGEIQLDSSERGLQRWRWVGEEVMAKPSDVAHLRNDPNWPKTETTDKKEMPVTVAVKAEPHGAACWVTHRDAAEGEERPGPVRLRIRWAVFLPLDPTHDEVFPDEADPPDYTLTLHGWFFVDSGRQEIDRPRDRAIGRPEKNLRHEWNRWMLDHVTLPSVIPSMNRLADQLGREHADLRELTKLLTRSSLFTVQDTRRALCSRQSWLSRLESGRAVWQAVEADRSVLTVPGRATDRERALRVFPALDALAAQVVVTFADEPRLTVVEPEETWSAEQVCRLLKSVPVEALAEDAEALGYARDFTAGLAPELWEDASVQSELVRLINRLLAVLDFDQCRGKGAAALRGAVHGLIAPVQSTRLLRVDSAESAQRDVDKAFQRFAAMRQDGGGVVVAPIDLAGGSQVPGELGSAAAIAVLDAVSRALSDGSVEEAEPSAKTMFAWAWIARGALLAAPANSRPDEVADRAADLELFPMVDYGDGSVPKGEGSVLRIVSLRTLGDLHRDRSLFKGVAVLAKQLQQATDGLRVGVVDARPGTQLFDEAFVKRVLGDRAPGQCSRDACLATLNKGVVLAESLDDRLPLFKAIGKDIRPDDVDGEIAVLRYLLHGRREWYDRERDRPADREPLLIDAATSKSDAWGALLQIVMRHREDAWRLLPPEVAQKLSGEQLQALEIFAVNRDRVIDELKSLDDATLADIRPDDPSLCRDLLKEWPEAELALLGRLGLHRRVDGEWGPIDEHTYIRGDFELPADVGGELEVDLLDPLAEYAYWADRDQPLAPVFGAEQALVEVLERLGERSDHQVFILKTLESISERLGDRLTELLRSKQWLRTGDGTAVAPYQVLSVDSVEMSAIELLCKSESWFAWAQLDSTARDLPGWRRLRDLMPNKVESGETLCALCGGDRQWCIGAISDLDLAGFGVWIEALKATPSVLPVYRVVNGLCAAVGKEQTHRWLVAYLCRHPLAADPLVRVLEAVRCYHDGQPPDARGPARALYNKHLQLVGLLEDPPAALPTIQLLDQQGKWSRADRLCVNAPGISRASILDNEQALALASCLRDRDPARVEGSAALESDHAAINKPRVSELDAAVEASVTRLEKYFRRWARRVSDGAIGGLLAFMGDHPSLRKLAERYLQPQSIQQVREQLRWVVGVQLVDGRRVKADANAIVRDRDRRMARHRFRVAITEGQTAQVPNLLGEPIKVNLRKDFEHLVVDHRTDWFGGQRDEKVTTVQLRTVDDEQLADPDAAMDYLAATLQWLLAQLFHQAASPDAVRRVLECGRDVGPLSIRAAQNRLLDALPYALQAMSFRGDGPVRDLLHEWSRAEYARAEIDPKRAVDTPGATRDAQNRRLQRANAQILDVRDRLRKQLLADATFQASLLDAVRDKMVVAQYTGASVPFELFQNADDAVSEWDEMRRDVAPLTSAHRRLIVEARDAAVRFIHWGRPINRAHLGGFDGTDHRFDQDLIKMLMVSGSDKAAPESQRLTTGRFGYGFKSVFLVSPEPRVISGSLGFTAVGGFYPHELDEPTYAALKGVADRWGDDPTLEGDVATVIELPLEQTNEDSPAAFLDRFRELMGLLPVFARQIDQIVFNEDNGHQTIARWRPRSVVELDRVWVADMSAPVSAAGSVADVERILVFDAGPDDDPSGARLVFALDANGVVALGSRVPTLWVTAPTRECSEIGVAFNAPFEPHMARDSLAPDSDHNLALIDGSAAELEPVVAALYDRTAASWPQVREALSLASDLGVYEFWASVWDRLADAVAEAGTTSPTGALLDRLTWAEAGFMRSLSRSRAVIPTGLPSTDAHADDEDFRRLVDLNQPRWIASEELVDDAVFTRVAAWPRFADRFAPGTVVHAEVAAVLQRLLGAGAPELKKIDLMDAIAQEIDDAGCVDPETAARIGGLDESEWIETLRAGVGPAADARRQQVGRMLQSMRFQANDGSWHTAESLVVAHAKEADRLEDRLRAAFAPGEHVLAPAYGPSALKLFFACRYRHGIDTPTVAGWMTRPTLPDDHRPAVLAYLLKSPNAYALSDYLRDARGSWLSALQRSDPLLAGYDKDAVARILSLAGTEAWDCFVAGSAESLETAEEECNPLPSDALERIARWWRRDGPAELASYERRVYPFGEPPSLDLERVRDDPLVLAESDDPARRGWMTLLMVGATQTLGRSRPQQHRGFIELCQRRGWLDTLSLQPTDHADRWMDLLGDYFEPQLDEQEYLNWMSLYPRLYQLSRWMHVYVRWLRWLDYQKSDSVGPHDLTSPGTSVHAEGIDVDAPPLSRGLGLGLCLVVRDLVRWGFLRDVDKWRAYCFMPSASLRVLMSRLGLHGLEDGFADAGDRLHQSRAIAVFVRERLGADADFGGDYDIPLRMLAYDPALRDAVLT